MAAFNKFNCFVADRANGLHNLGTDTLKVMLSNTAPVATNTVYSNITEIANGSGYTTGGISLTGMTSSQTGGVYKLVSTLDPVWTATGAVGPFRYVVLSSTKPLIGWWDYGSSISLASGETFTVDLDQTNGILQDT